MTKNGELISILKQVRVVPVVSPPRADLAVPLARALHAGGLGVVEVTLRTDAALESIRRIAAEVPEVLVGAGTVIRPQDVEAVREAGARFAVSPGLAPELARAAGRSDLPFLPGVMTPSEAMAAREAGFRVLKLFPAAPAGGVKLLSALHGPLPELLFCPTGGIDAGSFRDYLALPNVLAVGGSWVAPAALIEAAAWERITRLARETRETGS